MNHMLGYYGASEQRSEEEKDIVLAALAGVAVEGDGFIARHSSPFLGTQLQNQGVRATSEALATAERIALHRPQIRLQPDGSIILAWIVDNTVNAIRCHKDGGISVE